VTSSITNGLATTDFVSNYVNVATKGLASTNSVNEPTNIANFSFATINVATNKMYTNLNQRAQLVGTAILAVPGGASAMITLVINQGPITNKFPIVLDRGGSTAVTNWIPFNFPLNPKAVWYFTNSSQSGTSAFITNAVIVGE
jgi:hypothetical protein